MSNQNAKKSPGIEFTLFNSTMEIGMGNLGYLNSGFTSFLFCKKPAKKNYGVRTLTDEPPQCPQYEPARFLLDRHSPSKRTYYRNDPPPPPPPPHTPGKQSHNPSCNPHKTSRFV